MLVQAGAHATNKNGRLAGHEGERNSTEITEGWAAQRIQNERDMRYATHAFALVGQPVPSACHPVMPVLNRHAYTIKHNRGEGVARARRAGGVQRESAMRSVKNSRVCVAGEKRCARGTQKCVRKECQCAPPAYGVGGRVV